MTFRSICKFAVPARYCNSTCNIDYRCMCSISIPACSDVIWDLDVNGNYLLVLFVGISRQSTRGLEDEMLEATRWKQPGGSSS